MKKILMIVHTFPPIGSVGGSIRIVKFLKYINELKKDYYSIILTLRDDFVLLEDLHLASASLSEIPKENVKIIRTNTFQPRHPNPSKFSRNTTGITQQKEKTKFSLRLVFKKVYGFIEKYFLIPDYALLWAPYLISSALKESKKGIDIIYATAPPYSVLVLAVIIKKIVKKKLIIDIKDDWIYQNKFMNRPYIQKKIEAKLEQFCVRNSDKVILVTKHSYEDFRRRYQHYHNKFELITNGCDVSEYEKYWKINPPRNEKFTMIHSGVIAESRNPIGFLTALAELKNSGIIDNKNFQMKFIGALHNNVVESIHEMRLEDIIIILQPLEREEYIKSIINSDLQLAINYQVKTVIPGKIYDYWGSRKPILLLDSSDSMASKIIIENELGSVKDFDDVPGIKEAIEYYFNLWMHGSESIYSKITNLYNYDRKKLTEKLIGVIDSLS